MLALTATAIDSVDDDIAQQLGIPRSGIVNTGTYRPNLHYRVEQVTREDDKLARTLATVRETAGPGIVYTATVKAATAVHAALKEAGESVGLYHGRLAARQREVVQNEFMEGHTRVMVATNAFGLGIDKADLRFVLHYQMPSGLDAYYQESGRAGRDGETAHCTLLFLRSDKAVQQFFLAHRYPAEEDTTALYRQLHEPPTEGGAWDLSSLQQAMQRPRAKLQVALSLLRRQRIAERDRAGRIRLMRRGLDPAALAALGAAYENKRAEDQALLEQMVFYAQTGWCRWKVLLQLRRIARRLQPVRRVRQLRAHRLASARGAGRAGAARRRQARCQRRHATGGLRGGRCRARAPLRVRHGDGGRRTVGHRRVQERRAALLPAGVGEPRNDAAQDRSADSRALMLGGRQHLHRERVDLFTHAVAQRCVHPLVPRHAAQALELGADDGGEKVAPVAFDLDVLAGQPTLDVVADLGRGGVGGHGDESGYERIL